MSLESQVADLVTATTSLTQAVNVKKATLDQSVNDATAQVALATTQANNAAASAATASTKAGEAAGSAASALSIYGNTTAMQTAVAQAAAQASLAAGHAASASSVVQQDLSGVNAAALHRSPNAVVALSVYDTSKDSDGGAWTEKCQHTSWYNEAINGKWLGAKASESDARNHNEILGSELVANGNFDSGITGWTPYGIPTSDLTWENNNSLKILPSVLGWNKGVYTTIDVVPGSTLKFTRSVTSSGNIEPEFNIGSGPDSYAYVRNIGNGGYFTVPAGVTKLWLNQNTKSNSAGSYIVLDNVSVKVQTARTTASGDYFQLTTDGKFYRLWKNLLKYSANIDNTNGWSRTNIASISSDGKIVASAGTAYSHVSQNFGGSSNLQPIIFSFKAKAAELSKVWFAYGNTGNTYAAAHVYDITTGTVVAGTTAGGGSITLLGSELVGDYRQFRFAIGAGNLIRICGTTLTGSDPQQPNIQTNTCTQDGVSGIYLKDLQIEYGTSFSSYEAKTADASIGEVFRGNKRDFPRLSAIVAEQFTVTIYDLTEPGCPMWMRFIGVDNAFIYTVNWPNTCIAMGQSQLWVGRNADHQISHPVVADFAKDQMTQYVATSAQAIKPTQGIAHRNLASLGFTRYFSQIGLVNSVKVPSPHFQTGQANSFAITVLSGAPVDLETGLKAPTVAMGTRGGLYVWHHSGNMYSRSPVSHDNSVFATCFDEYGGLSYVAGGDHYFYTFDVKNLPIANGNANTDEVVNRVAGGIANPWPKTWTVPTGGYIHSLFKESYVGSAFGITRFKENRNRNPFTNYTNKFFSTGWMPYDTRRAYLADNLVESVSGTELITNGTFDTDINGWAAGTNGGASTVISWKSGAIEVATTVASYPSAYQQISTVVGRIYKITGSVISGSAAFINANTSASIITGWGGSGWSPVSGNFSLVFVASTTNTYIHIGRDNGGGGTNAVVFDNISVQEIVSDRSYKAQAASITGTLTKSPVANGAQLVAYSGFSA